MFLVSDAHPEKTALVCDNGDIVSYKDFKGLVDRFGIYLKGRSIVFLISSNDISTLVCYFAAIENGVVPLLLSEKISSQQLNGLIETYAPKYIFSKEALGGHLYITEKEFKGYYLSLRNKVHDIVMHKDLALLLTTSGSTGSPKLVKLTKKNIIANAESISKYLEIDSNDRAITSLPFNYSYGLSVINSHLFSGGSVILSNSSMMEERFWKDVSNFSATSIAGVPYHYDMMLRLGFDNLDITTVKKMTQAGGKLNYKKAKIINNSLKSKNIVFYTMYGQTEATARISYLSSECIDEKPNSIGMAIPGGKLWIENKEGSKILSSKIVGELIYQGENVSMGYAKSIDDLNCEDVNKGILKTGDLAYFDEDGYYFIEGRSNRFVKVFGNRVSLNSLEKLIASKGFEVIASGEEDKIIIYAIKAPGLSVDNLRRWISNSISINLIAIKVVLVNDFPRLDSGKINYKALSFQI